MTSRERLLAAFRREQPDRVPIHVRGVHVLNDEWVAARDESWRPLIDLVAAECDPTVGFPVRTGWLGTASEDVRFEHARRDGGDWWYDETTAHTPKGPLTYVNRVSKHEYSSLTDTFWINDDDRDLERFLSVPYAPVRPDLSEFGAFEESVGERGAVFVGMLDPIALVHELVGSEKLALWSLERRADVDMLIELFTCRLRDWIDHLLANDVRAVFGFVGAEYCLPPLMPPNLFRDWVTEPMRRLTAPIHAADVLVHVHSHGPLDSILEQFADMGGDILHPIEAPPMGDVPLADAKRRIGDRVCLEGNMQVGDLLAGDEDEVRDLTKRAIDDAAAGGGFVLCPTASPYAPQLNDTIVRNYVAMIETALEYGVY